MTNRMPIDFPKNVICKACFNFRNIFITFCDNCKIERTIYKYDTIFFLINLRKEKKKKKKKKRKKTPKGTTNERNRKEGNVLFNDALNTFYLRLYGFVKKRRF